MSHLPPTRTIADVYHAWRTLHAASAHYQACKSQLYAIARGLQDTEADHDADGYRWRICIGVGPSPSVRVIRTAILKADH